MGWKKDVKKAASSGGGVSQKEARKIASQYSNIKYGDVKSYSQNKNTWIGKSGGSGTSNTAGKTYDDYTPSTANTWSPSDYASIFQTIQTGQENLAHITGDYGLQAAQIGANAQVSSAGIRADADKEVARAYADAQKYGAELGLQGVKYGADKESEWRQAVANIEVKGKLDLQPIINAGLERVAGIEAQAQRDVAETTGKYGLESTRTRTAADERIGKMQLAGSMYGLLGAAFG